MAQPSIRKEIPHTVWLIFTCSFKSKSNKFPHGIEFLWFCSSVNVSQYSFVGQSYVLYTFRSSTYSVCTIWHCYWWMLLIFPPSGDLRWVIFPNDSCLFIYLFFASQSLLFDFGSELYLWHGKDVSPSDRKLALHLAQQVWSGDYDYSNCSTNPLDPFGRNTQIQRCVWINTRTARDIMR